jgi:hypothetical protein
VNPSFGIAIVEQGWIAPDAGDEDLCSHGRIRLVIGGTTILDGGPDDEVGISESALALLRTLNADHTPDAPIAEKLIFHGCGLILMMGCDIGVDWEVRHDGDHARLSSVSVDGGPRRDIAATLGRDEYERIVLAFQEATDPFSGLTKRITDDFDRECYEAFWNEYNEILGSCGAEPFPASAVYSRRSKRPFGRGRTLEAVWVWHEPDVK